MTKTQSGEQHEIILESGAVTAVLVDFRVGIFIREVRADVRVFLNTPFCVEESDGRSAMVTPGKIETLGPVLLFWNRNVVRIVIFPDGSLMIERSDGARIRAISNDTFEAWELSANSPGEELMIICGPEGRVSTFRGSPKTEGRSTSST